MAYENHFPSIRETPFIFLNHIREITAENVYRLIKNGKVICLKDSTPLRMIIFLLIFLHKSTCLLTIEPKHPLEC